MSPNPTLILIKRRYLIIKMMMCRALHLEKNPLYNIYLEQKFHSQLAETVSFGRLPVSAGANRGE